MFKQEKSGVSFRVTRRKQAKRKGYGHRRNPLNYLVGDAGLEPAAFGSGGQRSIHLS